MYFFKNYPFSVSPLRIIIPDGSRLQNRDLKILGMRECFLWQRGNAYYTHVRFPNRFPLSRTRPPARNSGHDPRSNNGSFRNCGQIGVTAGRRGPAPNIVHGGTNCSRDEKTEYHARDERRWVSGRGQATNNDLPVYPYGRA